MGNLLTRAKDDAIETLMLVKTCFSSFWFWLPVLYGGYMVLQIWMIVMVHPLTILIVPGVISAYLIVDEKKRMKAQYAVKDGPPRRVLNPHSLVTTDRANSSWDVEKALEEYEKMLKDKDEGGC